MWCAAMVNAVPCGVNWAELMCDPLRNTSRTQAMNLCRKMKINSFNYFSSSFIDLAFWAADKWPRHNRNNCFIAYIIFWIAYIVSFHQNVWTEPRLRSKRVICDPLIIRIRKGVWLCMSSTDQQRPLSKIELKSSTNNISNIVIRSHSTITSPSELLLKIWELTKSCHVF